MEFILLVFVSLLLESSLSELECHSFLHIVMSTSFWVLHSVQKHKRAFKTLLLNDKRMNE